MSVNGGYITAPSQEIQTDVPYENLQALIETAKEYSN
jgi:uroporphyrinogen-III decarboxylase